jgi:hypothetical protein
MLVILQVVSQIGIRPEIAWVRLADSLRKAKKDWGLPGNSAGNPEQD